MSKTCGVMTLALVAYLVYVIAHRPDYRPHTAPLDPASRVIDWKRGRVS